MCWTSRVAIVLIFTGLIIPTNEVEAQSIEDLMSKIQESVRENDFGEAIKLFRELKFEDAIEQQIGSGQPHFVSIANVALGFPGLRDFEREIAIKCHTTLPGTSDDISPDIVHSEYLAWLEKASDFAFSFNLRMSHEASLAGIHPKSPLNLDETRQNFEIDVDVWEEMSKNSQLAMRFLILIYEDSLAENKNLRDQIIAMKRSRRSE